MYSLVRHIHGVEPVTIRDLHVEGLLDGGYQVIATFTVIEQLFKTLECMDDIDQYFILMPQRDDTPDNALINALAWYIAYKECEEREYLQSPIRKRHKLPTKFFPKIIVERQPRILYPPIVCHSIRRVCEICGGEPSIIWHDFELTYQITRKVFGGQYRRHTLARTNFDRFVWLFRLEETLQMMYEYKK